MSTQTNSESMRVRSALEARYPGVRVDQVYYMTLDDGKMQQCARYQAPLEMLKASGLLTEEMLRLPHRPTALGEGHSLSERLDSRSIPGCWDLMIYTGEEPREYRQPGTKFAAKLLRQIMARKLEPVKPAGRRKPK